ncbi:hypothetical protein SODALDRAFT_378359 [Sodiomyces alkalinus F11]|uniref:Uncharacterized protein n=1 Tax=Sodiomyces alkalinus (strain CBS 110278 / VKM F-3762 / F11) TaxID=1314773 RepID=A0A3N2PXR6_SODAK|nr:hypothetical protein SODALDRAFT_378359 [Sodiomyces alkalinus F11]ROT39258.1 hypothetical protein SODALDRAFT_378359 [Sodiomyces alkalinus F11]
MRSDQMFEPTSCAQTSDATVLSPLSTGMERRSTARPNVHSLFASCLIHTQPTIRSYSPQLLNGSGEILSSTRENTSSFIIPPAIPGDKWRSRLGSRFGISTAYAVCHTDASSSFSCFGWPRSTVLYRRFSPGRQNGVCKIPEPGGCDDAANPEEIDDEWILPLDCVPTTMGAEWSRSRSRSRSRRKLRTVDGSYVIGTGALSCSGRGATKSTQCHSTTDRCAGCTRKNDFRKDDGHHFGRLSTTEKPPTGLKEVLAPRSRFAQGQGQEEGRPSGVLGAE